MGTINHDAVIATFHREESKITIESWIAGLDESEQRVFAVSPFVTNSYFSVVMFPDGSKEGWGTSNEFDDLRARFIALSESQSASVVHVSYGELGFKVKHNPDGVIGEEV